MKRGQQKQAINSINPQNEDKWSFIKKYLRISRKNIDKLSDKQLSYIFYRNTENAHSDAAQKLIDSRSPIASKYRPETNGQTAVKIIVVSVGAMMYVTAAGIFAGNLGKFRLPASLIGGGILSFIVDRSATKAVTNKGIENKTKTMVKSIEKEAQLSAKDGNPLIDNYFDEQVRFVHKIEGENLPYQHNLPVNGLAAASLNVVEFGTALWLMSNVTMFGGGIPLIVRPILSSLPVLFTWGFALYQRESFELPQHYAQLMPIYGKYVLSITTTELLINQEYQDSLVDAEINNIIDPASPYPDPQSARNQANKDYCHYVIGQLEKSHQQAISMIENQLKQDLNNVASQYQPIAGLNEQQQNERKQQWMAEEQEKIEESAQNELKSLESEFNAEINVWQRRIDELI